MQMIVLWFLIPNSVSVWFLIPNSYISVMFLFPNSYCHHGSLFQICIISLQFLITTNSYYFSVVPGTKFLLLHHCPLFQILIISLSFLMFQILIFHLDSSFRNCYNLTVVPYSKCLFFSLWFLFPSSYSFSVVPCTKLLLFHNCPLF